MNRGRTPRQYIIDDFKNLNNLSYKQLQGLEKRYNTILINIKKWNMTHRGDPFPYCKIVNGYHSSIEYGEDTKVALKDAKQTYIDLIEPRIKKLKDHMVKAWDNYLLLKSEVNKNVSLIKQQITDCKCGAQIKGNQHTIYQHCQTKKHIKWVLECNNGQSHIPRAKIQSVSIVQNDNEEAKLVNEDNKEVIVDDILLESENKIVEIEESVNDSITENSDNIQEMEQKIDELNTLLVEPDDEIIEVIEENMTELEDEIISLEPIKCLCGEDYNKRNIEIHFDSHQHDDRMCEIESVQEEFQYGEINKSLITFKQIQEESLTMRKIQIWNRNEEIRAIYMCECGLFMDFKAYKSHLKSKMHIDTMKNLPYKELPSENIVMSIREPIAVC